jgi:acetyl esterase/lipase
MNRRWARLVVLMAVANVACTAHATGHTHVEAARNLVYSGTSALDIYARSDAAHGPVLVLLHGCCGDRRDLTQLARGLAVEGAVVFNASWRSLPSGGQYPYVYNEAACAVRFARARAAEYGGDPRRITLLGWSDGALLGAVVAAAGDDFTGDCSVDGSALPDAFVGVGAFLGWPVAADGVVDARYVNDRTSVFFGGDPQGAPAAWRGGSPYTYVDRRPTLDIGLVVGAGDGLMADNLAFASVARAAGHRVDVNVVPGAGQLEVLAPSTAQGAATVRYVLGTARR